jgi:hypothetical protein
MDEVRQLAGLCGGQVVDVLPKAEGAVEEADVDQRPLDGLSGESSLLDTPVAVMFTECSARRATSAPW